MGNKGSEENNQQKAKVIGDTFPSTIRKPIVWTIAGSDSGGGAGIQADLHTFHDFSVHGCTVVTALTAQNSWAVEHSFVAQPDAVQAQLQALANDLPATAIKLGMLANADILSVVSDYLKRYQGPVVCDPVMCATSGDRLLTDPAIGACKQQILPHVSLITPNTFEAERLTGMAIHSVADMAKAAHQLLNMGVQRVLITGGHLATQHGQQLDYWTDGKQAYALGGESIATSHTHGSGCTLSAAITAALARGYSWLDALVLAKMYVTAGIRHAQPLGAGPGAVAHGGWPDQLADLPVLSTVSPPANDGAGKKPLSKSYAFPDCGGDLGLYPIVDHVSWLEKLLPLGVNTIQLRIKDAPEAAIRKQIQQAVQLAQHYQTRLFINDYWLWAVEYGAYGVHLGQQDLHHADLSAIGAAGLRLGISTHSHCDIACAHTFGPSYIALGPIYSTTTKVMDCPAQGVAQLREWVQLLSQRYPLTAIGGINTARAGEVLATGVGSCAVASAITHANDYKAATAALLSMHRSASTL